MSRKRKKGKKSAGKVEDKGFKQFVMGFFEKDPSRPYSARQVIKTLGIREKTAKSRIIKALLELSTEGRLTHTRGNRFVLESAPIYIIGTVDYVNQNFAYIETAEDEADIWVHTNNMCNALDGDLVRVEVTAGGRASGRPEGQVVEILKRERNQFVGKVQVNPNHAFVIPDFKKMHLDIFVHPKHLKNAKNNDKVIVEITRWHLEKKNKSPEGKVLDILGKAGDNDAEIHSIIAEFGLPHKFSPEILKAADKISAKMTSKDLRGRKDFRNVTTFTIDPEDAKDFDDALSYRKLSNGLHEIGIHIADVTHYVQEGSILDKEAFERATSVYLVDRTIPMLPERLSNQLCSLRPNEDKLTYSVVFEINDAGVVKKEWFGRAIIRSDRRFTYEEAQERLDLGSGDFFDEIKTLDKLAKKIKKTRFNKGAIAFETVEVKFRLDERGKPLGIIPKVRKDAHKLIEEFMLLANKKVAEHIYRLERGKHTFVYRVHDNPDPEKLNSFAGFAKKFGYSLDLDKGEISHSLNRLMLNIEGTPEQNVLESIAIRSMAKARYTTEPKGHFGLAFQRYTHFTSPIRRYPDVMVHRLLQHYLDGGKSPGKAQFDEQCQHASEREKRAANAERASIKFKQVEFMRLAETKDYDGIVSGITEWGIFVEIIETKCEGMVRISEIDHDYYDYDEDNYRIIGRRNKRMITLGDKVVVSVENTDIDRRTIDLRLISSEKQGFR